MILVTVGSQKFQFNRLLEEIDKLIERGTITEEVFAQIGVSDYIPKHYTYADFLEQDKILEKIKKARLIITHAGTGIIISCLKEEKKVIAIPRLAEFGEHVDDHQIQLIQEFEKMNLIEPVYNINELENAIKNTENKTYKKYTFNNRMFESIEEYIDNL